MREHRSQVPSGWVCLASLLQYFFSHIFPFATCRAWCIAVRHRAIELDWMPPVFMMWLLISVFHFNSKNLFSWKCFAGKRGIACMALNGSTGTKFFYVFNGYTITLLHFFTTHVGKRGCISLHRNEPRCRHKTHYSLIKFRTIWKDYQMTWR